uniref:MarR family transcriptional regulator n=1 Tax=Nocardiopsis sp. TaxID=310350 RepID=A0A7M1C9G9_9ACTN|nr:MarR family transcriptional regulator [Nocardiopsis sp.]
MGEAQALDLDLVKGALRFVPMLEVYYRRAHTEMPKDLQDLFDRYRLTGRHGGVLVQLAHEPELGVGELSARLSVGLSTVSELVGDLEWAGLVVRRKDPANRRRVLVALAEDHRETMRVFIAKRAAPLLRVFEHLDPRDSQGFAAGLEAWAKEVRSG